MRTKVTLVLLLLNVALFFFIFRFERAWRTEDALREARRRVLGVETADIRTLSVTSSVPGVPSYTVVRNRGVWMLTQPLDWPANEHAVRPIIQALQFLENETSFSVADLARNGQSLADYGLEKPRLTIAFASGEGGADTPSRVAAAPTTVLQIGDATKVGNRLYVLSPDGTRVHVVNRALLDVLSVSLDQLRADTLFSIQVFEAKALTVQSSGARVRIAKREANRWMFDTIVNARASKTRVELTINGLNALRATSFPSAPPTIPSASPTLRVTIDGNNRSETLLIGEAIKPANKAAASGAQEFYGQLMTGNVVRPPVFTVSIPTELLGWLRDTQTELRERRLLDVDPSAITSVTLAAPNQPPITLQRLDPAASDSPWQLARGGTGTGSATTVPADAAAVRHLIDVLTLLSAKGFASDAPTGAQVESWGFNRPEREVTIATTGSPGAASRPILLQLGTDTQGAVYARVGTQNEPGSSVYAVNLDLNGDLPVNPNAWRDRTVRALPAPARISSIKITDLANGAVVYETALDANEKPAAPPRDAAALQQLVAALRNLRAKRFVADRFTDHVLTGGEERAWRYAVDYSVVLPGAAGEQTNAMRLVLTDRVGGSQQLAGAKDLDVVFEPEQPLVDALWTMTYGAKDPGPQQEKK